MHVVGLELSANCGCRVKWHVNTAVSSTVQVWHCVWSVDNGRGCAWGGDKENMATLPFPLLCDPEMRNTIYQQEKRRGLGGWLGEQMSHVCSRQKGPAAERMRRAREKGLRHLGTLTRVLYGRSMVVNVEYREPRYRYAETARVGIKYLSGHESPSQSTDWEERDPIWRLANLSGEGKSQRKTKGCKSQMLNGSRVN